MRRRKSDEPLTIPAVAELEEALESEKYRVRFLRTMQNTIFILVAVAAVSVLVSVMLLPVVRIYGTSMAPTLASGEIVLSFADSNPQRGDIVAFYYNNKVLVKRVIAVAGEWVDIDEDGTVYVDSQPLDEPYLTEKDYGDCNIEFPYQVPDGTVFVLGDHRSVSLDSRNTSIGCISEEMLVGKLFFRIWPIVEIGVIS
jgi:signal peptidase I